MLRLIAFLTVVLGLGAGMAWLAERPGLLTIDWQGTEIQTSVFTAAWVSALTIWLLFVAWSIFRTIWHSPAAVGQFFKKRRQARGLDALSSGMIAIGAGDREGATRFAMQARKALPNEPLTHLLRAQAAQLTNDRATSRRIYEGMLGSRDTEALGLRGLFIEARQEGETVAARQFAQRALALNPQLTWASDALFDMQCKKADWAAALDTLASARKNGLVEKPLADRRRAILLTAQAQTAEDDDPDKALTLAQEAHGLAPNLVPAADIAGRLLASKGSTAKAAKVLQRTWKKSPHPDLALTYAHARPGDSPKDRLERVKTLALMTPHTIEAPIALANAAIESRDWAEARKALKALLDDRLTQRICTLMARIEAEEHGDAGRVREWLARAVNAPRDPTWTADGITSDHWAPVSPVSGELDAFEWRVPVESVDKVDGAILTQKLEEFVALGSAAEPVLDAPAKVIGRVTEEDAVTPVSPAPAAPAPAAATAKSAVSGAVPVTRTATAAAPVGTTAATAATATPAEAKREVSEKSTSDTPANADSAAETPAIPKPVVVASSSQPAMVVEVANELADESAPVAAAAKPAKASPTPAASKASGGKSIKAMGHDEGQVIDIEATSAAVKSTRAPKKSSGGTSVKSKKADRKTAHKKKDPTSQARVFVPPRAPDDPGTEARETRNPTGSPLAALRSRPVKGSA